MTHLNMNKDRNDSYSEDLKDPVQNGALDVYKSLFWWFCLWI